MDLILTRLEMYSSVYPRFGICINKPGLHNWIKEGCSRIKVERISQLKIAEEIAPWIGSDDLATSELLRRT